MLSCLLWRSVPTTSEAIPSHDNSTVVKGPRPSSPPWRLSWPPWWFSWPPWWFSWPPCRLSWSPWRLSWPSWRSSWPSWRLSWPSWRLSSPYAWGPEPKQFCKYFIVEGVVIFMFEFVGKCLRIRNLVQFFLYCIAYYCTSIPVGQEKKKKKKSGWFLGKMDYFTNTNIKNMQNRL